MKDPSVSNSGYGRPPTTNPASLKQIIRECLNERFKEEVQKTIETSEVWKKELGYDSQGNGHEIACEAVKKIVSEHAKEIVEQVFSSFVQNMVNNSLASMYNR